MTSRLQVLAGVRWLGEPVPGDRQRRLLTALVLAGPAGASAGTLAEQVWPEQSVADPSKALQVVVSRARSATAADVIANTESGYRLDLAPDDVDLGVLRDTTAAAGRGFDDGDWFAAAANAEAALSIEVTEEADLVDAHAEARSLLAKARRVRGIALSKLGEPGLALPLLESAHEANPDDDGVFAALLRSLAIEQSPAEALERYEGHRRALADRLGIDPSSDLQRLHVELMAADHPVREGLRFEATTLVGRDSDIEHLEQLVAIGRVTSIVGPGGLGKTRLSQVLAQRSRLPSVHFIELVSVTTQEDVVGEVGSALGVRDSVVDRDGLTPQQRADTRGRIAQHLQGPPTLLILDNCEQVVEAVAELVAFLVATVPELRVVTTTRAPLRISGERIYQLDELTIDDGVELFVQRATGVRPSVNLDRQKVAELVERLDGLPLAIELAAAQIRVMSLSDIVIRIDDRFTLLRGGAREAPDRHQTLLNVLEWSWQLLDPVEQSALARLSVFHDGFVLEAASQVLGEIDALESVRRLVDQSLLTVLERHGSVRYRMLESVREFGRMKLEEAGETAAAKLTYRQWALGISATATVQLGGKDQYEGVDAVRTEDANLTEVLRDAMADEDLDAVVHLAGALELYWAITGDHARSLALNPGIVRLMDGWVPSPASLDALRLLLSTILHDPINSGGSTAPMARRVLASIDTESDDPRVAGFVMAALALHEPEDGEGGGGLNWLQARTVPDGALRGLIDHENRHARLIGLVGQAHQLENSGDAKGARVFSQRALDEWCEDDGPWLRAMSLTMLADMQMQIGDAESARKLALEALPILQRLRADDDVSQVLTMLVFAAIYLGDLDGAQETLDRIDQVERQSLFAAMGMASVAKAELLLAHGDIDEGLRTYRIAMDRLAAMKMPGAPAYSGMEPWSVFGDSTTLSAFAWHGADSEVDTLYVRVAEKARGLFEPNGPLVDYPLAGMLLFALGLASHRRECLPASTSAHLLALGDACGYKRWAPSMSWERAKASIDAVAPGAVDDAVAEIGNDLGAAVRRVAEAVVADL